MWSWLKSHRNGLLIGAASALFYLSFAYDLNRPDFPKLIGLFAALFVFCHLLIKQYGWNFWLLAGLGLVFRLLLLPAVPNLSQDFYRFIWDGRLLLGGINPYLWTPNELMAQHALLFSEAGELVQGMGSLSAGHYSNYPPINQLCFGIAAWLGGTSMLGTIVALRIQIILADIGILLIGKRLLQVLGLPVSRIFWFFLNPFIILEATGNLHFETVMLFFLLAAIYLLYKKKWFAAAILWGLSISVKLLPLLFLPLLIRYFVKEKPWKGGLWKTIGFWCVCMLVAIASFLPFASEDFVQNFIGTIGLWFQNFEFNASVHYIIRWISFKTVGWNQIQSTGPLLSGIVLLFVMALAIFRSNDSIKKLMTAMLWSVFVYLLLATTVHPWYVATPLLLCLWTPYRFPIIWSGMVMLSYSAYGPDGFREQPWLIALEYTSVIGFALWELKRYGFKKSLQHLK